MRVAALLFCCFLAVAVAQHSFGDKLFRPRGYTKPSYFADPFGIMFNKFHEVLSNRNQSDPLFPDLRSSYGTGRYKEKTERTSEYTERVIEETTTQSNRKQKFAFEGETVGARIHPDRDKYIMASQKIALNSLDKRESNVTQHSPYDLVDGSNQCSGRGKEVGDLKNICQRRDCHVNILRCLPDYSIIVDSQNYTAVNLDQCKVEELQCMEEVITFDDWSVTRIHQVTVQIIAIFKFLTFLASV